MYEITRCGAHFAFLSRKLARFGFFCAAEKWCTTLNWTMSIDHQPFDLVQSHSMPQMNLRFPSISPKKPHPEEVDQASPSTCIAITTFIFVQPFWVEIAQKHIIYALKTDITISQPMCIRHICIVHNSVYPLESTIFLRNSSCLYYWICSYWRLSLHANNWVLMMLLCLLNWLHRKLETLAVSNSVAGRHLPQGLPRRCSVNLFEYCNCALPVGICQNEWMASVNISLKCPNWQTKV